MTAPLASRLISAICAGSPEKYIRFEHQFGMGILLSHAASIRPCRHGLGNQVFCPQNRAQNAVDKLDTAVHSRHTATL
ncbi:hypothetical protein FHJ08_24605, partial [Escherichia coli]|nr:hypothetical protein [Escherichia coli]